MFSNFIIIFFQQLYTKKTKIFTKYFLNTSKGNYWSRIKNISTVMIFASYKFLNFSLNWVNLGIAKSLYEKQSFLKEINLKFENKSFISLLLYTLVIGVLLF
jgi:hypothetical protein